MNKLKIKLNKDYKSFQSDFETSLEGDLIVLSGVNGSGKSQLMDIIRQYSPSNPNELIDAHIILNTEKIRSENIIFRSFREGIQEMASIGISNVNECKGNIWNFYQNGQQLNVKNSNLKQFQGSAIAAKNILIQKFGEQKFRDNQITHEDVNSVNFGNLLWIQDDPFSNVIGELIFNYARKVLKGERKYGSTTKKFKPSSIGVPPWIQLNELFAELNFEYRFEDEQDAYFLNEDDMQLNKIPQLYQLKKDGDIDKSAARKLADLSDGEKAIVLLIFAAFNGDAYKYKKLLLLDEFDATFNPSLIKPFYKLLNKYFVSKGIVVVIVTHSPVTISLASRNASFYEIFSSIKSARRVFPVQRDTYSELRRVSEDFYAKFNDQQERILLLNKEIKERDNKIEELSKVPKKVFLCEDEDSNTKSFWEAAFANWGIRDIKIISTKGCTKFHQEDIIMDKTKEDSSYKPRVFRQIDRDGLTDRQVTMYEKKQNGKYSKKLDYKLLILPVNAVENFAIIVNKEKFDNSFWEKHGKRITAKFERTAISRCLAIYNLFDRSEEEFNDKNGVKMQEMRDSAIQDKNMFLHGKEIAKNSENFNVSAVLIALKKEEYPKELKIYLKSIKLFFK